MYSQSSSTLTLAEPKIEYGSKNCQWVEVLVDCPYAEGLYTYAIGDEMEVQAGDILSVPFGNSVVGAIALKLVSKPPETLEIDQIKTVEDVITSGFFPPRYWELLTRVSEYYLTDLIYVIKCALPPKLLGKSQKRVRLLFDNIPQGAENFCPPMAWRVLQLLQNSKNGDYTFSYINQKVKGARRGINDLVKRDWAQTYLQPPAKAKPKYLKVVTFISENSATTITQKQRDVLAILKANGGELSQPDLMQKCELNSNSVINSLAKKGCVVIQERESLRLLQNSAPKKDLPKVLTEEQQCAFEKISSLQGFNISLLHGVTGSGKTEVYLRAIAPILAQKKSALVLVPEIGLTPQLTDRFRARFGQQVCVYHSALSDGERYDTWRQMLTGEPQVVIGTRSAVFAPLPNLGMIILDEEHDTSFKQSQPVPPYHAKTVAQWRAELVNCPLILGSATPSLESWQLATEGQNPPESEQKNHYLSLPNRVYNRPLPPVEIVDMRQELRKGNRSIFSHALGNALGNLKEEGKQAILFISRRGHSTFVSCRSCGYVMECPHCDVSLSYHYPKEGATQLLRCHYCNHTQIHPRNCPECGSPYLKFFGTGTQKVLLELQKAFPELKILRFDSDTTSTKNAHRRILEDFEAGKADVLIGTQMLTKGIDLAQVTLVGVVSADGLLFHSDYRASERAFQTLTQVAGRAGRGDDPGQVIIQTYSPEHPVIGAVQTHNYSAFIATELEQREALDYPPYGSLILLKCTGADGNKVREAVEAIVDVCEQILPDDVEILGPAPANVMRVARRYRWQILLKSLEPFSHELKQQLLTLKQYCPSTVSFSIDVDPIRIE
ncbi:primosomal protein N' PriA [Cyanobacterium sp. HL-69]|uniref:primosomal protein N' n=1 Tax=Cyanobacterium sp. HL-69 TaxID=2054282 RepID=UPI000CA1577A|nr:primosomal protein N' PriA [Cyanobacterium sp. HL-69]